MHLKTAKEVRNLIQTIYGVTYSIRQIECIMKKLGYAYTKPYQIYSKMPKNAEIRVEKCTNHLDLQNYNVMFMDQTYCLNQDNSQRCYHKIGTKNMKEQPTEKISINGVGIQAINGNSFLYFLDNTKTFEMMKYMVTVVVNNLENKELKLKLEKIINNKDLEIDNILNTINQEEIYYKLLNTVKDLSENSKTFEKLYKRLENNPLCLKTKSNSVLENLQKAMLLSYFYEKEL